MGGEMKEHYKQELLLLIETAWSSQQIEKYIAELHERLEVTKEHIRALQAIKKRKNRNKGLKDTGARDGR